MYRNYCLGHDEQKIQQSFHRNTEEKQYPSRLSCLELFQESDRLKSRKIFHSRLKKDLVIIICGSHKIKTNEESLSSKVDVVIIKTEIRKKQILAKNSSLQFLQNKSYQEANRNLKIFRHFVENLGPLSKIIA